jgi:L-aminopeptidase/D-esterase-like protein
MAVTDTSPQAVPGLLVGHWTNHPARTGCTVLAFDQPALSAAEVRGAAPGTRELECLAPGRLEQYANAIVLTGGSAFGLAAADGVAHELARRGIGYQTSAGVVPIVPTAVIFDLANGEPVAPTANEGAAALRAAVAVDRAAQGAVGAGTGATWAKLTGTHRAGGIGIAQEECGAYRVTAFVVLNAMGVVRDRGDDPRAAYLAATRPEYVLGEATTLIATVTDHPCDHGALMRLCVAAHDALARMVIPAHTMYDGDVAFATTLSEGSIEPRDRLRLALATELAVEAAVLRAARPNGSRNATLGT